MTNFDQKQQEHLRQFFLTDTGQKLLIRLRESDMRPKIRLQADPHEIQMDAGQQMGYDKCIENIEKICAQGSADASVPETPSLHNTRLA